MKALQNSTLITKSLKELVALRNELRKTLFELKMKHIMRSLEQPHLLKIARRNIARINTAIATVQSA